jgi:photosystem II stability/assembly factor-like uncharacterized protein
MAQVTTFLSPSGQQLTTGSGPATRIQVGTLEGVATLERAEFGAPWQLTGWSLVERHVAALVYEEISGKLFAAAHADGGLWVSDDGEGKSWRPLTNGLDRPHMYTMAARRRSSQEGGDQVTLFLGTRPAALYRSDDLGESWTEITSIFDVADTDKWTFPPPPHIAHVKQIMFHPAEPDTLYVLVEQGAFLKSIDDGKSWTDLTSYSHPDDASYRDLHRLVIKPDDPKQLVVVTGVGIYRSNDAGQSYEQLTRRGEQMGYPDFAFLDPQDDTIIYSGGSELNPRNWYDTGIAKSSVMRSTDNGDSWANLGNGLPNPMVGAIEGMAQHVWDGGMMLLAGTATGEVFATEDRGESWQLITDQARPVSKEDHHLPFISEQVRREVLAARGEKILESR